MRILFRLPLILIFSLILDCTIPSQSAPTLSLSEDNHETKLSVSTNIQPNSVMFIENVGQFDDHARFQVRGVDRTIWLAQDAIWFTLLGQPSSGHFKKGDNAIPFDRSGGADENQVQPQKGVNLRLSFVGANSQARLQPFNRLETSVNYFIGNEPAGWRSGVSVWGGVRYQDLYPGLDLEITSEDGQMVSRIIVRDESLASRHSSLAMVRFSVEGAEKIELDGDSLRLTTAVGEYTMPLLELMGGATIELPRPSIASNQVISPFTRLFPGLKSSTLSNSSGLFYSTYLGGSGYDVGTDIAVDSNGAAYVVGSTWSSDFPTTPGSFDTSPPGPMGNWDVFVVKLNEAGSALDYATFLGGITGYELDYGFGIAIDSNGAAYVTGVTESSDFPTTPGAFDTNYNGGDFDAFVVKLNEAGSALAYSTFIGGNDYEESWGISIDSNGAAYVIGNTWSFDFPTTPGAFDTSHNGDGNDVFVVKLNGSGSALAYATFLGGSNGESGYGIAVDSNNAAYVTGETWSSDFPTTPGAFDTSANNYRDAFLVKLNAAGSALEYATYLGGSDNDWGKSIATNPSGNAYVTGYTSSYNFPTTPGAFDTSSNGWNDVYVVKMNGAGSALEYATLLGGSSDDYGHCIALDLDGAVYVTGWTKSYYFPTTPGAYDVSYNGSGDVFVAKLNGSGSSLEYATFLGGSLEDKGNGIAIDTGGAAYITGETRSQDFPTTPGAFDTSRNDIDWWDSFVVKLVLEGTPIQKIYLPLVVRDG
jgi:hypothetical protein